MEIRDWLRFNARVLEEGLPPGFFAAEPADGEEGTWPASGAHLAFDGAAAEVLHRAGISFSTGAGGVVCRLDAGAIQRLAEGTGGGASLAAAARAAWRGWCRNGYDWEIGNGRVVRLGGRPRLMGILNVTPDSFSDGGCYADPARAVEHAVAMAAAGADLIDVGGESTRPGAEPVSPEEEAARVVPVVRAVAERVDVPLSVDTTKAEVAAAALEAGASVVNDISGCTFDPAMPDLVADREAGVVVMHIRGVPRTMQEAPSYGDALAEVCRELRERVARLLASGVPARRVVVDPGIGFGKRFEDNLRLLAAAGELRSLGFPILLGYSRKSFLGRITGRGPSERTLETAALSALSAGMGVQLLRVHDVEENRRAVEAAWAVLRHRRGGAA